MSELTQQMFQSKGLQLTRLTAASASILLCCTVLCPPSVWAYRFEPELEQTGPNLDTAQRPTMSKQCLNHTEGNLLFDKNGSAQIDPDENLDDCITPVYSLTDPVVPNVPTPLVLKGVVEKNFKADIEFEPAYTLHEGETLIVTVLDFLATGYNLPGDPFNGVLKEPIKHDGKILVPAGALVKGHVVGAGDQAESDIYKSRIELSFDAIVLPNGQEIPLDSTLKRRNSRIKQAAQTVASGVGGGLKGAVKGVLVGLQFGGIEGAILSDGITLLAGGGIGALVGTGKGLARSDDQLVLQEGDTVKVKLDSPLDIPDMADMPSEEDQEFMADGLQVDVTNIQLTLDPFQIENQIRVALDIDNATAYDFGLYDFALVDAYGGVYQVSPFSKNHLSFDTIPAHDQYQGEMLFSIANPQISHYLVVYKPYTREVIGKVSLHEALKRVTEQQSQEGKSSKKASKKRDS